MQLEDTFYEVLEVSPRARPHVIKAAYRVLAQQHHPDKNAGAQNANARLARINDAYAVLSDQLKRSSYDRQIGLQHLSLERRGVHKEAQAHFGSTGSGHTETRPFGFRPL